MAKLSAEELTALMKKPVNPDTITSTVASTNGDVKEEIEESPRVPKEQSTNDLLASLIGHVRHTNFLLTTIRNVQLGVPASAENNIEVNENGK